MSTEGRERVPTYRMHEKMFSVGDDFWIEDAQGHRAFRVDGKVAVVQTFSLDDAAGNRLYKITKKIPSIKPAMHIEGPKGRIATVAQPPIKLLRDKFTVKFEDGVEWEVGGNMLDREYEIKSPTGRIARITKKLFGIRDTYAVDIAEGQADPFVLAVVVVVDAISHPEK
jgi:uncharacterized protein YxjI